MLFNSYIFIFGFLPVVWLGFYQIGKSSHAMAALWLAAASLFFYGWWDVRYVGLLLASIAFNYAAGYLIGRKVSQPVSKNLVGFSHRGQPDFSDLFQIRQLLC
jgi:D-alanyl-lipoteichoic acid acyltransferase DltB (MBOAT superfamily)